MSTIAHKMVADLAEHLANEIWEELASCSNVWYAANSDHRAFINRCAPSLVPEARQILAKLLTDPDISPDQKDKIHEALTKDAALPGAHNRGVYSVPIIH